MTAKMKIVRKRHYSFTRHVNNSSIVQYCKTVNVDLNHGQRSFSFEAGRAFTRTGFPVLDVERLMEGGGHAGREYGRMSTEEVKQDLERDNLGIDQAD